jgi:hypothetical protein
MNSMKSLRHPKRMAWLFIQLAILLAICLPAESASAQGTTPTPGPYPTPLNPYPNPETATIAPTSVPTLATTPTVGAPPATINSTAAIPNPTTPPAVANPEAQSTLDLQANPQSNGPAPTYVPLPAITFQLPDQSTAAAEPLSQAQTSATPVVDQGNGGADRWIPLGVILVIWGLLAGWFYLSFRRLS